MQQEVNPNLVRTELKKQEHKVNDDGSVTIIDLVESEYKLSPRDFISHCREVKKRKEHLIEALSDESKLELEKAIVEVGKDLDTLEPFRLESESKAKEHYEKLKLDGMLRKISEELEKPMGQINTSYMAAVWENIKNNETKLMGMLSSKQKKKFLELKRRKMTSERGKGRK